MSNPSITPAVSSTNVGTTPMPELIMSILEHAYAQHPWRSEGDDLPRDIALDPNGVLPVWWNQVQKTAALLDIPPERLPAILMRDTETL
ncbi:MAG: hypothetical protein ACYDCF_09235, partial [Burkholderiales bacterium]